MMRTVRSLITTALLTYTGCISYRYNLEHVDVDPKAKLSQTEVEQIVWTRNTEIPPPTD